MQFSPMLAIYLSLLAIQLKVLLLADVIIFCLVIDFVFFSIAFSHFLVIFTPMLQTHTIAGMRHLKEFDFYPDLFLSYILVLMIFHLSFLFCLLYFQFLLCALLDYLCVVLFLSQGLTDLTFLCM